MPLFSFDFGCRSSAWVLNLNELSFMGAKGNRPSSSGTKLGRGAWDKLRIWARMESQKSKSTVTQNVRLVIIVAPTKKTVLTPSSCAPKYSNTVFGTPILVVSPVPLRPHLGQIRDWSAGKVVNCSIHRYTRTFVTIPIPIDWERLTNRSTHCTDH